MKDGNDVNATAKVITTDYAPLLSHSGTLFRHRFIQLLEKIQ
jgi:hypothetical protein